MRRIIPLYLTSFMYISMTAFGADQAQQGIWQQNQPESGAPNPNQVIARGLGGELTVDAVNAYIEALEFSLAQVGQPTRFDPNMRIQIAQGLIQMFPMASMEIQANLVQARAIWMQHAQSWNGLAFQQKQEFVYEVLSVYLGEQVAANAVSLNTGGAQQGAAAGGNAYTPNDVVPNYSGEGCWAAAGCVEHNADDDSYTYEEYDPGTDSYEPE